MMLMTEQKVGESHENELDPAYALFRDQTRFWIQRVAVPLLMVIGLFGNAITVIIMTRRRMRSTTNMYLAALAFVDMLYLVLTFLLGLSHYPNMSKREHYIYWRLKPFLMMLTDACSNTSVWLTVTFTIERYIAVKYPMKGKVWCTEVRAKMLIVCVFALGIIFAAPVPFEWKVVEVQVNLNETIMKGSAQNIEDSNITTGSETTIRKKESQLQNFNYILLVLENTDFGNNSTYRTIYYWSTAAIFYFIPLFSLMLFNGFLILSVHQSRRERTKMIKPSEITEYHSNTNRVTNLVSNDKCEDEPIPNQVNTDASKDVCQQWPLSPNSKYEREIGAKESQELEEEAHRSPVIDADSGGSALSYECTEEAKAASKKVSSDLALPTDQQGRLSELTVQINCDKEFVNNEEKNRYKSTLENANQTLYTSIQEKQSYAETGNKNLRGMIKTIGELPISRTLSLKRTLTMNSSSRSMNHPASLAPGSSQERRITIMLISVVILFLVCQIPTAAMLLYTSVRHPAPDTNEDALVLAFGNIFNFLMAVNAAGNFILYSFLSKKYRRTFILLFCKCFGYKQKHLMPKRSLSVRFETSGHSLRNSTSIYQNTKLLERVQKDTPL